MDRRTLMAGFGAASLGLLLPGRSLAQGQPAATIQARRGALSLRSGSPETPVWMLDSPALRFRRGDNLQLEFANDLTVPVGLDWRGIDGVPAIEPLIDMGRTALNVSDEARARKAVAGVVGKRLTYERPHVRQGALAS